MLSESGRLLGTERGYVHPRHFGYAEQAKRNIKEGTLQMVFETINVSKDGAILFVAIAAPPMKSSGA